MLYMVTFTIIIPPMLAYIPYMDPMGIVIYIYNYLYDICIPLCPSVSNKVEIANWTNMGLMKTFHNWRFMIGIVMANLRYPSTNLMLAGEQVSLSLPVCIYIYNYMYIYIYMYKWIIYAIDPFIAKYEVVPNYPVGWPTIRVFPYVSMFSLVRIWSLLVNPSF